jgi:uncharacterized protein YciI
MHRRLVLTLAVAAAVSLSAQEPAARVEMDHYVMAFLKRGPKWTPEVTPETTKIQEGHMANIRRMAASGKLILAGPFEDDTELRGVFLFRCSMEEARKEAAQDPAVKAGRLVLEFHPWFAPKGIGIVPPR